jgi:hypothetical protein
MKEFLTMFAAALCAIGVDHLVDALILYFKERKGQ